MRIFLAIRNLIGNNSRIENNIRGKFLYEQIFDIEITECITVLEKTNTFKGIIDEIFVTEKKVVFIYDRHWFLLLSAFLQFIRENALGILFQQFDSVTNEPVFIPLEPLESSKNLTFNNINNLFKLYFFENK
jgi:hypothetical protein